MRRMILVSLSALAAVTAFSTLAEAQAQTANGRPLVFTVRPRSFLDPGPVAPVGSLNRYVTAGQNSLVTNPPWSFNDRFLPNMPTAPNGTPFVGATNPFRDIDTTGSIR